MSNFKFLIFVVLTFICWGTYGPVLHIGQAAMGDGPGKLSSLRPFICVGMAYFLIAVVYPLVVLRSKGESGNWSAGGIVWSLMAGFVGVVGALGIILAFKFQGRPVYVMPLVFGLAPIVNTFVTMSMTGTFKQTTTRFFVAIAIVAFGAAGVLTFKPKPPKHDPAPAKEVVQPAPTQTSFSISGISTMQEPDNNPDARDPNQTDADPAKSDASKTQPSLEDSAAEQPGGDAVESDPPPATQPPANGLLIGLCIATTALCWGSYGPVLHRGQSKMNGSRLRPFLCVGLAYFAIAVIVPSMLLGQFDEPGGFSHIPGVMWSLLAGVLGAIGALGIIYAFNFGGKPIFVMPLVFGFAPVVNTLTETVSKNLLDQVSPYFIGSLTMVMVGAVMVLLFAPRGPKPKTANEPAIT